MNRYALRYGDGPGPTRFGATGTDYTKGLSIMTTAVQQPAAWPEGVIARYLTVGGAGVDIRHDYTGEADSVCSGCGETNRHSGWTGLLNPTAEQQDHAAITEARRWSQSHAERCRAMPKPGTA